jgi:methionyl-tRNA formyltransferase
MSGGVVLLATKALGLRWLREIARLDQEALQAVITFDDRADVRSALGAIQDAGEELHIPVHVAVDRDDSERILLDFAPRLAFCVSWYWFVRRRVLEAVPLGVLGVHFSLLPRYRGGSPLVWAMIHGERESGVSLFTLVSRMDEGDIWAQRAFPIGDDEYIGAVLTRAEETSIALLRENFSSIWSGELQPRPQMGSATVFPMRKPEDGKIDWSRPSAEIFDFIRAQSHPYPGAFAIRDGRTLRIWRCHIDSGPSAGQPSFRCSDGKFIVADSFELE